MNAIRNFIRAVRLSLIRLFWPETLAGKKAEHSARLNSGDGAEQEEPRPFVRRLLIQSFTDFLFWIVPSAVIGCILGRLLGYVLGFSRPTILTWLLIAGVSLAYLARSIYTGWEIRPSPARTRSEKVNIWMYRALLVVGTVVGVSSLTWPQCPT